MVQRVLGALERYDRHATLVERDIELNGVLLHNHEVGQSQELPHGKNRHQRMLQKREFDLAEVSLGSFLAAKAGGLADDLVGVPIFPRRLFSVSQLWRLGSSDLNGPADLAGRRVGIRGYQITLSVLLKGDLQRDHGVDWRGVSWFTEIEDVIPAGLPDGVSVQALPQGVRVDEALTAGMIDAFAVPHPPDSVFLPDSTFVRLMPDPKAADEAYLQRNDYWPVMHLIAVRRRLLEDHPDLGRELMDLFAEGRAVARSLDHDPNGTLHPWGQLDAAVERQRLGEDLWIDGFEANRANLIDFIGYCWDQGLLARPVDVSELFHEPLLGT